MKEGKILKRKKRKYSYDGGKPFIALSRTDARRKKKIPHGDKIENDKLKEV